MCYADRLADGGRLVGVEERMAGLVRRRPELATESAAYRRAALALEAEISTRLATDAATLLGWLRATTAERLNDFPLMLPATARHVLT